MKNPSGEFTKSPDLEAYLDERRMLLAAEQSAAERFDRWLLTLAGGSLALSMTFLKDLAPPKSAAHIELLSYSWCGFGFAIVCILISMLVSQRAHEEFREDLDTAMSKSRDSFLEAARRKQDQRRKPVYVVWLNRFAIVTFTGGIGLLAYFVYENLGA